MNAGAVCPGPGRRPDHHAGLGPRHRRATSPSAPTAGRRRPVGRSSVAYALEGSVFVSGAGVQWLRDGLGIIDDARRHRAVGPDRSTAARGWWSSPPSPASAAPTGTPEPGAPSSGSAGAPAGPTWPAPWSRPWASRSATCSTPWRPRGTAPSVLRVDGGASAMALLLQLVADQTRLPVVRPASVETTALGAATLAGLAEGVWGSLDDLAALWTEDERLRPPAAGVRDRAGPRGVAPRPRPVPDHWVRRDDQDRLGPARSARPAQATRSAAIGSDQLAVPGSRGRPGSAMVEIHWRSRSRSTGSRRPTTRILPAWAIGVTTGRADHRVRRGPARRPTGAGSRPMPDSTSSGGSPSAGHDRRVIAVDARRRSWRPGSGAPGREVLEQRRRRGPA